MNIEELGNALIQKLYPKIRESIDNLAKQYEQSSFSLLDLVDKVRLSVQDITFQTYRGLDSFPLLSNPNRWTIYHIVAYNVVCHTRGGKCGEAYKERLDKLSKGYAKSRGAVDDK